MADELVYRLVAGEGVALTEDGGARTVDVSVPGLAGKVNVSDLGPATEGAQGLIELVTTAEARALTDATRAITPARLADVIQSTPYDTAANRILRVGSFGRGATNLGVYTVDLNTLLSEGISYVFAAESVNAPFPAVNGVLEVMPSHTTGIKVQRYTTTEVAPRVAMRSMVGGVWRQWQLTWDSSNFDPTQKANINGTYPAMSVGNSSTLNGVADTQLAPPGQRGEFYTSAAPLGWLKANGAAVSRTTYARLFAAIGTFFGAGNGSTTFNLPDDRGLFSRAWDDGAGVDSGRAFGSVQKGSLHSIDTGPTGAVAGDRSNNTDLSTILSDFGVDRAIVGTYPNARVMGVVATSSSVAGETAEAVAAVMRPVNRAVLVCIKT